MFLPYSDLNSVFQFGKSMQIKEEYFFLRLIP